MPIQLLVDICNKDSYAQMLGGRGLKVSEVLAQNKFVEIWQIVSRCFVRGLSELYLPSR